MKNLGNMAAPTSGELSLLKIWSEKNEDDYTANNADGQNSFSLEGLSRNSRNDSNGGNINLNSTYNPLPDEATPHKMSEFYGYDHDLNDGSYSFSARIKTGHYYYISYVTGGSVSTTAAGYHGYRYDLSNSGQYSFSDGSKPGGMVTNAPTISYSASNNLTLNGEPEHIPNDGTNDIGNRGKFGHNFTNGRACSVDRIWNASSRYQGSGGDNGGDHKIYISFHGHRPTWQHFYVRWHESNTWVDLGASSTWDTSGSGTVYGDLSPSGSSALSGVTHNSFRYQKTVDVYTYSPQEGTNMPGDMYLKTGHALTDGYGINEAGYDVRITGINQDSRYWVGPVFTINSISNVSTSGFTSGRNITAAEENRQIEGFVWVNTAYATDPKVVSWNGETLTGGTGREFDLMTSSSGLLTSTGSTQYSASPGGVVSLIANNTYNVAYVMAINSHPQYSADSASNNNRYVFSTNTRSFTIPASNDFSATVTTGTANFYTTVFSGYITSPVSAGSISNTSFNGKTITGIYFQNSSTDYIYIYFSSTKPSFSAISINGQSLGGSSSWTSASSTSWRKTYSTNLFGSTGSSISITAQY